MGDGPYTHVAGTFNVPSIYSSPTNTDTAEWVGIDGDCVGVTGPCSDSALIQAGVTEAYVASTNMYTIWPWWEILPAPSTPIPTMVVAPNDTVTVAIDQVSGSVWQIAVSDNTTGQSFTIDQTYGGPLTSAEWILEAPNVNGAQSTVGDYAPAVTFSNLRLGGPVAAWQEVVMVQGGAQVSTPSTLAGNSSGVLGFTVAYGGVPPPAP
ncbi:MAG TPA: G1 family glutamic endopeptidase [Candidatus Micrarchaeia archaeon]|nr:G1 family glutamic endopeptidase [Candidatus Micrarchaeia archaeon]